MAQFLNFIYSQLFVTPRLPNASFKDQVVIVTGSNTGLGREAARHIAALNAAKVILAVRSTERGEVAKRSIEESTRTVGVVEVWPLDLSSYDSVRQFAARAETLPRLDVLLENAGVASRKFKRAEGDEATITVNVVNTFLLGLLLLPKLRQTAAQINAPTHLTIVSSEVHGLTSLPEKSAPHIFDRLNDEKAANMNDRYSVSKLLEVFAVRSLAKLCQSKDGANSNLPVIVNCLNPGFCHSELMREADGLFLWLVSSFKSLFARTTELGSRTLVAGAAAGVESHGQYMTDCHVAEPAPLVRSAEGKLVQERVWKELCAKLEKIQPGILQNI